MSECSLDIFWNVCRLAITAGSDSFPEISSKRCSTAASLESSSSSSTAHRIPPRRANGARERRAGHYDEGGVEDDGGVVDDGGVLFVAYFFWNRSMRPAASTNFCLPV